MNAHRSLRKYLAAVHRTGMLISLNGASSVPQKNIKSYSNRFCVLTFYFTRAENVSSLLFLVFQPQHWVIVAWLKSYLYLL